MGFCPQSRPSRGSCGLARWLDIEWNGIQKNEGLGTQDGQVCFWFPLTWRCGGRALEVLARGR